MQRYAMVFCAALLALHGAPSIAAAVETHSRPRPPLSVENLIEAARAALARGAVDDAAFLLRGVKPGEGNVDDLDFLHGWIALRRSDWQSAIARFRAMLARNPDLPRVRFDLAVAYFQAGEDGNAAYHFRLALGDDEMPAAVRARALGFLDRIRRRKTWTVTGSAAIVPDSNINAATDARRIALYGHPAELSADARRTSGVGVTASVSAGHEIALAEDLRFRISAGLRTRTYRDDRFNERVLSARWGPRFLFGNFDLRPEMTLRERRIGGEIYSRTNGLEVSGNWLVGTGWQLTGAAGMERIAYEGFLGTGRLDSLQLGVSHAPDRSTLVRADTGIRRETVDRDAYSWREYVLGVSARREFPLGFVLTAGPSLRWREYGAPLAAFGPEARRDRALSGRVTVSNRHVALLGFMPELTVRHERRYSNLTLYEYRRTAAEIGAVRSF